MEAYKWMDGWMSQNPEIKANGFINILNDVNENNFC